MITEMNIFANHVINKKGNKKLVCVTDTTTNKQFVEISYKNALSIVYTKKWYDKIDVMYELVKNLKNKETVFLQPYDTYNKNIKWGIKAFTIIFLQMAMKRWKFIDKYYNMYYTIANYTYIPTFNYIPEKRYAQTQMWLRKHTEYIKNFDYVLDFDMRTTAKNIKRTKAYKECKQIKKLFDDYSMPYNICFSGGGWHIRIKGDFMEKIVPERDKALNIYRNVTISLKEMFNASTLDITIYDNRRIWKSEYSIDTSRGIVLIPLTDEEFENFKKEDYELKNIINIKVFKKGMLYRSGDIYKAEKLFKILGGK